MKTNLQEHTQSLVKTCSNEWWESVFLYFLFPRRHCLTGLSETFSGDPGHHFHISCKHKRTCDKESAHRINQTAAEHTAELTDNQCSAQQNNNNPLFCRYSPKFGNYRGEIINRLICHICIFQKFSPSLTVACARSRSHHRSQTSDSRNIRCTFWPEIRHFRRSGELLWSALSPPLQSALPGLIASEGVMSPPTSTSPAPPQDTRRERRALPNTRVLCCLMWIPKSAAQQLHLAGVEEFCCCCCRG